MTESGIVLTTTGPAATMNGYSATVFAATALIAFTTAGPVQSRDDSYRVAEITGGASEYTLRCEYQVVKSEYV